MTDSEIIKYAEGYESVPQAEIDALTRDDLLAIATDFGSRRWCGAPWTRPTATPGTAPATSSRRTRPRWATSGSGR